MSIKSLERIARIRDRKDVARYRDNVSRAYIRGLMSTAEYCEYRRYLDRVSLRLAR